MTDEHLAEPEWVAAEQAALRRVATLVAEGAGEEELAKAVTAEIGRLFEGHRANLLRWDGDTIRVIGRWRAQKGAPESIPLVFPFGGDTITARIVESGAPARLDSAADLQTEFAQKRWKELGLHASIGAPILVDGKVWGLVTAFRTQPDDPFPPGVEHRLADFAALVAQAIMNAEARSETAKLLAEQSALRRIATLIAGGRPQTDVLDAVTSEVGPLFGATAVDLVCRNGTGDDLVVVATWRDAADAPAEQESPYRPERDGATLTVIETGSAGRSHESPPGEAARASISAPVVVQASIRGALTASRPGDERFPAEAEIHLCNFADLAAQSIANEQAQRELRASRARIVRTADETRRRFERNLHDGAQQRLISVSLALRLATARLSSAPEEVGALLAEACDELTRALEDLRDLGRGLHPALLTVRGLGPALEALAGSAPFPVELANEIDRRLPQAVEAALYYVVSESLTNVARYAQASNATVRIACAEGVASVEVADDGVGGAEVTTGSGLQGLADRVEALGGRLHVESTPGEGTTVSAEIPLGAEPVTGATGDA